MKRILVADDEKLAGKGVEQIATDSLDMNFVGEAKNGNEALHEVENNLCDLVIVNISLFWENGIELLRQLKAKKPQLPVVILSNYPKEQYARLALRAGADGYLTKESTIEELMFAIKQILQGYKYFSSSLVERMFLDLDKVLDIPPHQLLSEREYQVMSMIVQGKTEKEIANQLSVSVKTVSTYRYRLLEKMKMKSNAELTRYAVLNNLIP